MHSFSGSISFDGRRSADRVRALLMPFILSAMAVAAAAMPGHFDRGFGSRGQVRTSFGTATGDKIFAMAVQADGRIVAAGASLNGAEADAALARYNPDGTPDTTFGNAGRILLSMPGSHEVIYDVGIQTDGRIVVAGSRSANGDLDFFLARFNTDGALDAGFGTAGIVTLNIGTPHDTARALAFQNVDGEQRIVAAGSMGIGPTADFAVARLRPDGALDTTFALGTGVTFVSWGHEDSADAVAIQKLGGEEKIVVAGKRRLDAGGGSYNDDFALTRLNANGTMDTSFGTNGKVNTNFAAIDIIRDIVIQETVHGSKIVAGGIGNNNFALVRYHENGAVDSSFGTQGRVQTSLNTGEDQIHDLSLLPDGRILAGGFTRDPAGGEVFALARYLPDGQTDPLFGGCGTIAVRLGRYKDIVHGVAAGPDGRTLAAGYISPGGGRDEFVVARFADNSAAAPTGLDFDGDGRTDPAVFRPADGTWHLNRSCYGYTTFKFGLAGDVPAPADYDGDGKTDAAVYRDGVWYVLRSKEGFYAVQFGLAGDIPSVGDYDDDGRADIAVWRPSNGVWYILRSSDGGVEYIQWGKTGDIPVAADHDGDHRTDAAVWRPSEGVWYVRQSADSSMRTVRFGLEGDAPLVADFDGDGRPDPTVFRPSERTWYAQRSTAGFAALQFGLATDLPVTGDYDGDGKTDHAVYREGVWHIQQSRLGYKTVRFGLADDLPLSAR